MIDGIDERLKTWVENVLGAVNIALTPPRETQTDPVVYLYLMRVAPVLAPPNTRRPPRQVMLHYLVTVRAPEVVQAHRLLGDLIFAAFDSGEDADFELDFDPLPVETWLALGVEPQPAFILKVPLTRERQQPDIPLVRVPMVTRVSAMTTLQGVVVGPQDLPLQGALVELPGLRQHQRTDARGHFRFAAIPVDPPVKSLRVTAKGHELELNVEAGGEPVVIRLFEDDPS